MLSSKVIAGAAVCALGISAASHAQVGETDATRRETANVMRNCGILGGWVKITVGERGRLRAERSPSLTPAQNACVDAAIGRSHTDGDGRIG